MPQQGFGTILRTARERKGIDFNVAARRLRIRPDILQAIEDMNFAAMPPRGYSRNMINGYARYLGLNATDITRLYLDQLQDYQRRVSANNARPTGIDMSAAPNNTRIPRRQGRTGAVDTQRGATRSQRRQTAQRDDGRTLQNSQRMQGANRNQIGYDAQVDPYAQTQRTSSRNQATSRTHRNEGIPATGNAYTNFYSGPAQRSKLPFIIAAAAVLVIIIIIVCVFLFGGKGSSESEVATMPVTGVSNTTQQASEEATTTQATGSAPTSFTFEYSIPSSTTSWVEVWVDGNPEIAESVTGPSKKSFTCSGTLEFVCANPTGVTAKQDGKAIDLTPDSSGVVSMTIEFSDILEQWQKDHPGVTASTSSTSSSSASSSTSSTSSSSSSTSSTSSTSATQ